MPRFRTTQFNNPQYSSSDYTKKIKNRETLKFARSIIYESKITDHFILDCMLEKEYIHTSDDDTCCDNKKKPYKYHDTDHYKHPHYPDHKDHEHHKHHKDHKDHDKEDQECCKYSEHKKDKYKEICQPAIYIAVFENYSSMIDLLLEQATLDDKCYNCADVPITLNNALTSEFCFDDYFDSISKLTPHPCKCLPIKSVDICKLENYVLYPYGHFNNNNPDVNKALKRKLILNCSKKDPCPTYVYCKCPPNETNCKCCDYTVTFPFKDTFVSYVVSGCHGAKLYNLINNPGNNPNKTFYHYNKKLGDNRKFQTMAINSFSRNYII